MFYNERDERTPGRIVGGIAAFVYAVSVLCLLLLVKFTLDNTEDDGNGILINFRNVESAAPGADMAMNDQIAEPAPSQQPSGADDQEQLTQDFEDAPVVEQVEKKVKKEQPKTETKKKNTSETTTATPAEKPREVNKKALFPGRTAGSKSSSDGTGTGKGNQGDLAGSPEGAHDGTGLGTSGNSANLSGRSLIGALPKPDYRAREQGRVIIEIVVDQQGNVTSAAYRSVGSTTQNSVLVNAALRAARQAKFNVDDNAPISQRGTITYNFRMQ